ncbi:DUF58 domain-containing protein [Paenibacillus pasadenensis]|uniref:DUF58 domain-containing protein n=1 Tax=Paenibacillus pasadenensis TaxID=217090 RepID=UPI0004197AF9|nr:DUF58 domain-containing protein [Paenibacillus pasadenensis]
MKASSGKRWHRFRSLADRLLRRAPLPTPRLAWWTAGGGAAAALAGAAGRELEAAALWLAALAALSAADLARLPRASAWSARRELPESAEIGREFAVRLELTCRTALPLRVELADDIPDRFDRPDGRSAAGMLERGRLQASYRLRALERGRFRFREVDMRWSGGLGLWRKQAQLAVEDGIRIDPDLSGVRGVLASAQDSLLVDGKRIHRRQRGGTEFDAIREYAAGDDIREVNWRATARSGRLLTNLYRPEKGKTLVLLLDCGRQMGVEMDGRVKLDRTLEAALTLAAAALRQGDLVALIAYSSRVKLFIPPGRGLEQLQTLTRAASDIAPDYAEAGAAVGLGFLLQRVRRRSFAVLFSDMDHYLHDAELLPYAAKLRKQHHLVLMSLQNPALRELEERPPETAGDAYVRSMAASYALERQLLVRRLGSGGVPMLDASPDQLATSAVSAYLDIRDKI